MIEFLKSQTAGRVEHIEAPEPGCWVNAVAPTPEERTWLEQELGVMGQRKFLQLDPEDAAALRGQLLGFELASWEEAYQPYAAQDDSLEWSVEVLSDVQGFSSKGSGAWPYYLPFLFEELQRFGVANMWVRGH